MRWALIAFFSLGLAISSAVHANDDACGHCDGIADWFERVYCVQQCLSEQNEASPLLPLAPSDDDAVAGITAPGTGVDVLDHRGP